MRWMQAADAETARRLQRTSNRFRMLRLELLRSLGLTMLAAAAVDAHELDTAARYAGELLARAERSQQQPNAWPPHPATIDALYAEPLFYGHTALGRVAIAKGDIPSAERHLLLAAETPGSPELRSFGPTMVLAQELLDQGRVQPVLEYLRRCQRFWHADNGRLARWIEEIEKGERPHLRALLDPLRSA
jgi:hypothetical protein